MSKPCLPPPVTGHYRDYFPRRLGTHALPFLGPDDHSLTRWLLHVSYLSREALGSWLLGFPVWIQELNLIGGCWKNKQESNTMGLDKQRPNKLQGGNYKKMAEQLRWGRCNSRCQPLRRYLPRLGASRSNHHYVVNQNPWGEEWEGGSWEGILWRKKKDEWKSERKAVLGLRQGPSCPASSHGQWCMISQGCEKCSGVFSHKLSKPTADCMQLQDFLSLRLV